MKKINLNSYVKVKLTPYGVNIYYHQYDELNKRIASNRGTSLKPRMPQIDKNGYTVFQLHSFINIYGEYLVMGRENVIEDLSLYFEDDDVEELDGDSD